MAVDLPTRDDVLRAAAVLDGVARRTIVQRSHTLDARAGAEVLLKCESFQRVGAFKFRGAYNAVHRLSKEARERGVITHSSGNHAQGLALAARLHGVKATVVMPDDAPPVKRAATEGYGARIVPCAGAERESVTRREIDEHGYTLVHPYDDAGIIAGQGTAALELFDDVGELDALFVPVGGGGLASGSALAASLRSPECKVFGVEPACADDGGRSFRDGRVHTLDAVPPTIADGLRTRHVGERNLAIMRGRLEDMLTVSEDEIIEALRFAWLRLKLVIEPSAAVALAPVLAGRVPKGAKRVGVVLSGGNFDPRAIGRLIGEGDPHDGGGEVSR